MMKTLRRASPLLLSTYLTAQCSLITSFGPLYKWSAVPACTCEMGFSTRIRFRSVRRKALCMCRKGFDICEPPAATNAPKCRRVMVARREIRCITRSIERERAYRNQTPRKKDNSLLGHAPDPTGKKGPGAARRNVVRYILILVTRHRVADCTVHLSVCRLQIRAAVFFGVLQLPELVLRGT